MKKYKLSVYAITKNEEKNVLEWYKSMSEADEIVVLDTGSTDNTVKLLKSCPKIKVYEKMIKPWRFDKARNESLAYVSNDTDICVCTDLDERFEKGWSKEIKKVWRDDVTRGRYLYNWSFDEQGKPGTSFYINKIHSRDDYIWEHPVHEVLVCKGKEKEILISGVVLNHYQDFSKSRTSYLPLLELSVKEDPLDDRNMHYLGREYMYYKEYDKAIETLHKHLALPKALWKDERCASMRYMAFCYYNKGYTEEAIWWYKKAIKEAPYLREPYFDLGYLYYSINDYVNSEYYLRKALKIDKISYTYINEEKAWNETIYDILAYDCFMNKKYSSAYKFIREAIKINKNNKRLLDNYQVIKKTYLEKKNRRD